MIRYDIARLTERRKGTAQPLPPIHGSLGAEKSYLKALRAILQEMAAETRETIVPLAMAEIAAAKAMTKDVEQSWFERLINLSVRLNIVAEQTVNRILGLEAKRHTETFMATAKRVLGVDLSAVVRQEDLGDYLRTAATRNAALIKGLSDDMVKRVQHVVTDAVINGRTAKDLKAELTKQFYFGDNRAKLIARDQIGKLNSDLNRIRHQQAGISEYTWRTSHDERVRPLHKSLDGKVYEYGKPTGAEDGLPPGQPIMCRCIAQAIVTFGDEKSAPPLPQATPAQAGKVETSRPKPTQRISPKIPAPPSRPAPQPSAAAPEKVEFETGRLRPDNAPLPASVVRYGRQISGQEGVRLRGYKADDYAGINELLRTGDIRESMRFGGEGADKMRREQIRVTRERIKVLDEAISKASLSKDVTLYRGIADKTLAGIDESAIGTSFDFKTFQSASLSENVATRFAVDGYGRANPVLLKINAKAGSRAIDMDRFGAGYTAAEKEVLLPRGAKFTIRGVSSRSGRNQLGQMVQLKVVEVDLD